MAGDYKINADFLQLSIGGGGANISSRTINYDYVNGVIKIIKTDEGEDLPPLDIPENGGIPPNLGSTPKINVKSEWDLDVGYTFVDSHPNELKTLNVFEEMNQYLDEHEATLTITNRINGFGGDPKIGTKIIEDLSNDFISVMSKYRGDVIWTNMSADGGTAVAVGIELLKYKNEIHGKNTPYIYSISFPSRQKIMANIENIEYNKNEIGDYTKRGHTSVILYTLDHSNMVSHYNETGKPIDKNLYEVIMYKNKPPLSTPKDVETADLEFIKATAPLRYIMMGSNEYHKIYRGAIVDREDVLNKINGKVVIPCYLKAKNVNELAERVSLIRDPLFYENGDVNSRKPLPEAGIASTIYNCMAPYPEPNRIDSVVYIVKINPGMNLDFSDLTEKVAEFASQRIKVKSNKVEVWTFEGDSTNRDIECWAYLILDDYKGYIDESIRAYIGKSKII